MRTRMCETLGAEYPIFGFSPSKEVVAAISRAGGFGVLGAVGHPSADELETSLQWIDENVDGRPYGVDVVMPMKVAAEGEVGDLQELIPVEHRAWVDGLLDRLGVPPLPDGEARRTGVVGWMHSVARSHVDVALGHPIGLIANALGSPPKDVIDAAHEQGVLVAALAGKAVHAERHVQNGVDVVVAQGYEAGGHTGEIASMVLVPEIVDAVGPDTPVLAAGGIGSGRQVAAALALGADGVWMGSYWLTTQESMMARGAMGEMLLGATSSDTVRSRVLSGKPARMLRNEWTEAWVADDSPGTLPMPLQGLLVAEATQRVQAAQRGDLMTIPVGQIVGRMNEVRPVQEVFDELVAGFREAAQRLHALGEA